MANKSPKHIAVIMDGNGRWAKARRQTRIAGHKAGLESVRAVIKAATAHKIEALSLFAFSSENWGRPKSEVMALMELFYKTLQKEVAELHSQHISIRFIGDRSKLTKRLQRLMASSETLTADNTGLKLVIAIDYGGNWDVVQACQSIAKQVAQGRLQADDIDESLLKSHLATCELPDPDLFIRTSGEMRLSNFYLLQLAYTELYFYPGYWPDFQREQFEEALQWFASRERRYGYTSEQMRESACLEND